MTDRYRVAVVGLGKIGLGAEGDPVRPKPASHIGAWDSAHRAELVAGCDPAYAGVWGDKWSLRRSVADLLQYDAPLDIVSVATPPATHREIVEACATAKVRLVICEKPLALTSQDAEAMVAICQKTGTILLTNHFRRFDPMIREAAARVAKGEIGQVVSATGWYTGGLWEGGSHMVDLMRMFCGEVTAAESVGPDLAALRFASGLVGTMQGFDITHYVIGTLTLLGTKGSFILHRAGLWASWYKPEPTYPLADSYHELALYDMRGGPPRSFFPAMTAHAVACLDGTETPVSTGEDGRAAVRILEQIEGR